MATMHSPAWYEPITRENHRYDVWPRVIPSDKDAAIHIRGRYDHVRLRDEADYDLAVYATEGFPGRTTTRADGRSVRVRPENGVIRVPLMFYGEQEHVLRLYAADTPAAGRSPGAALGSFRVYSLRDEWFSLRPYKGDMHLHSTRSDGLECPEYVAGACRVAGLDFMALTDHEVFQPSVEVRRFVADLPSSYLALHGEEVHPPGNPIHILHFGGTRSVMEEIKNDVDAYQQAISDLSTTLIDLPDHVDADHVASCMWCSERIRGAGGICVLTHPYWMKDRAQQHIAEPLLEYLYHAGIFDGVEISSVGIVEGQITDPSVLNVARYYHELQRGCTLPPVGTTDGHSWGEDTSSANVYSVCLAESLDEPTILGAVRAGRVIAVEAYYGHTIRVHGAFDLVKYVAFLVRELFPQHDWILREQGRQILRLLETRERAGATGSPRAAIAALEQELAALQDRFWGRGLTGADDG